MGENYEAAGMNMLKPACQNDDIIAKVYTEVGSPEIEVKLAFLSLEGLGKLFRQ